METRLRIATWNIDRPRQGSSRKEAILEKIREINADILVLTETCSWIQAPLLPHWSATSLIPAKPGENYASIWSKYPINRTINTFDAETAICAEVETPAGPVIVYGTIITWRDDKGPNKSSKPWEEHYKSIQYHGNDWLGLAKAYPTIPLVVAGDFNQSRDGSTWYGTPQGRELLSEQLAVAGLVCSTQEDMVKNGKLKERHNIDHICISSSMIEVMKVGAWEGMSQVGVKMSDHNGVYIDVKIK